MHFSELIQFVEQFHLEFHWVWNTPVIETQPFLDTLRSLAPLACWQQSRQHSADIFGQEIGSSFSAS